MAMKKAPKRAVKAALKQPAAAGKAPKATKLAAPNKSIGKPATRARVTAKASPLRGMSLAAWIDAKADGWQAPVVKRLIELIQTAAPDATASIKWSQPVFERTGPFAFIKLAKAHVTFGFWRGAELTDPAGVLEGGETMKHVKIKSVEVDERTLVGFVRQAVALNAQKGDPTRRAR